MKARGLHNLMQRRAQFRCPGRPPHVCARPRPRPHAREQVERWRMKHAHRLPGSVLHRRNRELELLAIEIDRVAKKLRVAAELRRNKRPYERIFPWEEDLLILQEEARWRRSRQERRDARRDTSPTVDHNHVWVRIDNQYGNQGSTDNYFSTASNW